MPVTERTYEQVALEDHDSHWELECGELRRKPDMTSEQYYVARWLAARLNRRLDENQFQVATDNTRLRISTGRYYVPDLCVIPMDLLRPRLNHSGRLEVYDEPLPLVVEVWSPATGEYDVETKFPEYRHRGDQEIWRIHPYEQTLTAWVRGVDGSYTETLYHGGVVVPAYLPTVRIDLDELFRLLR